MLQNQNRLTAGPVLRGILLFTLPILLGNLFQNLYSMADTVIVGRLLGLGSLAAVGSTGPVSFLVIGFVSGTCAGMAIPVAQRCGAGDLPGMRRYLSNAIFLSALLSLVLTPLLVLCTRRILTLMLTPEDILDEAARYMSVIFAGIPATFLYNLAACALRSVGDSRTPLHFLLLSSVLNILLDIVSVAVLGMDVRGPALATVVSQLVSGSSCLLWIRKNSPDLRLSRPDLSFSRSCAGRLLSSGIPMGLQYSITAVGTVILQTAVNTLGSVPVAAVAVASRIGALVGTSEMDSLGTAIATYVSQNYGAGNYRRIADGMKKALAAGFAYDLLAFCFMFLFSGRLALLFISDPAGAGAVAALARQMCVVTGASYFMLCILSVLRFSIQGLGYSYVALLSGVAEMAARALLGLVFVPRYGFTAACFTHTLAWLFADLTLAVCWIPVLRKTKRRLDGLRSA